MKVCVIDDDPLMLRHLEKTLIDLGFQVAIAPTVDVAIETMRLEYYDAAVIDMLMPDRDGLEFIMEIRQTRPNLRIVAISGGGRIGAGTVLKMADGLGADATLIKPFSANDLERAIRG